MKFHIRQTSSKVLLFFVTLAALSFNPSKAPAQSNMTKVMTEQILKLEIYLQELKKGYSIVQQGLTIIGDIKKGDFDLHSHFFNSLKEVKPEIKNWVKVGDIIAMQAQILYGCATALPKFAAAGTFSPSEIKYLSAVFDNLKSLTNLDITELTGLVSDGNWQMTDDERISRIDQLYNKVSDKTAFFRSFADRVGRLSIQRSHDKSSILNFNNLFQP